MNSTGLFFVSAASYFVSTAIGTDTVLGDAFRLIGVLTLLIGVATYFREKRAKKILSTTE